MLGLARRTRPYEDSIEIGPFSGGEKVLIRIDQIRGDKVQVAIDAPRHVKVLRQELVPPADQIQPK